MKIEEAIRELEELHQYSSDINTPETLDAIKMGIEALKREQNLRKAEPWAENFPFSGES